MKCLVMFIILMLGTFAKSKDTSNNYFSNFPVGKYKLYMKAIMRCGPTKEHALEYNLYLYKISSNASELRGNLTLKKRFDNTFNVFMNMAVKDSMGGWKDNYYQIRLTEPCTKGKPLLDGAAWQMLKNNFEFSRYCPFSPGVYISKSLDFTSFVEMLNIPKQFFYGTYKSQIELFDNNGKQASCFQLIFDIKRPWELVE